MLATLVRTFDQLHLKTVVTCDFDLLGRIASSIAPNDTPVHLIPDETYVVLPGGEEIMKFYDSDNNIDYVDGQANHHE